MLVAYIGLYYSREVKFMEYHEKMKTLNESSGLKEIRHWSRLDDVITIAMLYHTVKHSFVLAVCLHALMVLDMQVCSSS